MNRTISKYIDKLFFKKWIIGLSRCSIEEIIRSKVFNPNITWLNKKSFNKIFADPFFLDSKDGKINLILEDFTFKDKYAKISLIKLDEKFRMLGHKILLDSHSHLSYPFVFTENDKTFVFPEASRSGKLSCYEYDQVNETLNFLQNIIELPLLDSTIFKHKEKYWIFGTLGETAIDYKLNVYFSEQLLGPYISHSSNPVASGLNGTRSAGNCFEVDGVIYRPTQNCKKIYGESITINKVSDLSENRFAEEPYMNLTINKNNKNNFGVHTIHTINVKNNIIVVDGKHWTFSPFRQLKKYGKKILKWS